MSWLLCLQRGREEGRSPCSAGALRLIVVCAARSAPSTSRNMVGAALQALHNRDPFRLRDVASALHLPEWLVACLSSLLLTIGMSVIQLFLVAPLLRAALQPVFAMSVAVTGLDAPPVLQPFWTSLINHKPFAEVVSMPVFPGLMSAIYYFLSCLPFAIVDLIDWPSFRSRFKHQPSASQKSDAWYCALFLTGWHHVFYIMPGLVAQVVQRGPWLYLDHGSNAPPCMERCDGHELLPPDAPRLDHLLIHLATCFLLFDASYHFWHWAHHASPVLYRHIHAIHHEYRAPFCWVTQHEHALELLVVSVWSVLVPMGLGCHPLTEWLFLLGAIQVSVEAHSGYSVGLFAPLRTMVPFGLWGGSQHHDSHHKAPRRNFQPFFTYLDRAFGTLYDPDAESHLAASMHRESDREENGQAVREGVGMSHLAAGDGKARRDGRPVPPSVVPSQASGQAQQQQQQQQQTSRAMQQRRPRASPRRQPKDR